MLSYDCSMRGEMPRRKQGVREPSGQQRIGGRGGCYVASSAAKEVHIVGAVGIIHETIDRCFYRFINKTLGGLGGDSSGWIEGFFG